MSVRSTRRSLLTAAGVVGAAAVVGRANLANAATTVHIYVAGDSTASIYTTSHAPRAGWGQALPIFTTSAVSVVDMAKSGRSSKSYVDEGWLTQILAKITSGDILLISFGHNDEKTDTDLHTDPETTYKQYLSMYVDGARAKGAKPVLVTPVERRRFDSLGRAVTSHGAYPGAMRELAAAKGTPLVDLSASSLALWNSLGSTGTKTCFLYLNAGESPNYPSGVQDDTHFKAHGAIEVARLVATPLHNQGVLPAADFRRLTTTNLADSLIVWPA
ncbi:rhamnogalacturonan acetylesterase [Actinoplanes subtropicus]|uniref:rhamnogalacturonan acetylesterase n=1 Tax=Actinoplanes subtropicus TaxID=543632 RepID=UPI0006920CF9|nr:rhamnogalacturonan acetylesterase [Actinoplanes subtropicus]